MNRWDSDQPAALPPTVRTVGLRGLKRDDQTSVHIFLGQVARRTRHEWQVVQHAERVDLLVLGPDAQLGGLGVPKAGTVVRVLGAGDRAALKGASITSLTLTQPLQFIPFLAVLLAVDSRLGDTCDEPSAPAAAAPARPSARAEAPARAAQPAAASPAARERVRDTPRETPREALREATTPPPPPQPSKAAPERQGPPLTGLLPARFRLKRWPGADALIVHRYGHRLASFLSSRELSLMELVQLSNVDAGQCRTFLSDMLSRGWLEVLDAAASPTAVRVTQVDIPLEPEPEERAGRPSLFGPDSVWLAEVAPAAVGLFRRLKDKLGLGGGRQGGGLHGTGEAITSF